MVLLQDLILGKNREIILLSKFFSSVEFSLSLSVDAYNFQTKIKKLLLMIFNHNHL